MHKSFVFVNNIRGVGLRMQKKIKLISAIESREGPTILLTTPHQDDEQCSITLGPIGEPPLSLQAVPLSSDPLLTCAEMEVCGHRFNAMALIAHFAKNAMTCPMCRAGLANNKMDMRASFPNEPWTAAAFLARPHSPLIQISADYYLEESEYGEEDAYLIGGLSDGISTPPTSFSVIVPVDVNEMSMFVVFVMFRAAPPRQDSSGSNNNNNTTNDMDIDEPCIRLQCPLVLNNTSGTYELSVTSRRQVSTIISEMRVHSLSAGIFARHEHLYNDFGTFPLSTMPNTRLSSNMVVALVNSLVDNPSANPPHLKITVQVDSSGVGGDNNGNSSSDGENINISEFIYTPPQMAYIRRLLVAGG